LNPVYLGIFLLGRVKLSALGTPTTTGLFLHDDGGGGGGSGGNDDDDSECGINLARQAQILEKTFLRTTTLLHKPITA
jgi:hypothetical protein